MAVHPDPQPLADAAAGAVSGHHVRARTVSVLPVSRSRMTAVTPSGSCFERDHVGAEPQLGAQFFGPRSEQGLEQALRDEDPFASG